MSRLPRSFYARKAITVARALLGKHLVHVHDGIERRGRIVEVEAYLGPHDLAAHSARGLTPRTRTMFGPPGHAYVYLIYGIHHCMNVVCEPEGKAAAVLLRALEPVPGSGGLERAAGPGLLCKAMGLDRRHDGHDLLSDSLYIDDPGEAMRLKVVRRPRIGVDYAGEWAKKELRFYIADNPHVSRR
jgi:DNA-3-methyladenine glycosylase